MLTEYVNDHRLEADRELRALAQARPRYGRNGGQAHSLMRRALRSLALPPARATTAADGTVPQVVIRPAASADGRALARLAEASERRLPSGLVLIAEVDSRVIAALPVEQTYVLSDLLHPTSDVVQLLELRSEQLLVARRLERKAA